MFVSVSILCCGEKEKIVYVVEGSELAPDTTPPAVVITRPSEGERVRVSQCSIWICFIVTDDRDIARITSERILGGSIKSSMLRGRKSYSSYFVMKISTSGLNRNKPTKECYITYSSV